MPRKFFISLALIALSSSGFPQDENQDPSAALDTSRILYTYQLNPLTKQADTIALDTTIQEILYYNPIYKISFSNSFLGNNGQAYQSNDLIQRTAFSPFIFEKPYTAYLHSPYSIIHYDTRKPYTQIEYLTFGRTNINEQVIEAVHTQNFNENTNFGLVYNLVASRGIYLDQGTKSNRFTFFGSYVKNAYSAYGSISLNKVNNRENGGLVDIPVFEQHIPANAESYLMYLDQYDNASFRMRKKIFFFTQTLNIQKTTEGPDSLKMKKEGTLFHLNHTFTYTKYNRSYNDNIISGPARIFYDTTYYETNTSTDSASSSILENSFQISGDKYKFLPGFVAGIKHQYQTFSYIYPDSSRELLKGVPADVIMTTIDPKNSSRVFFEYLKWGNKIIPYLNSNTYNNLAVFFVLKDNIRERLFIDGSVEYFFSGYRQNDLTADFALRYSSKNKKNNIAASANFYLTEPDFFLKQYSSSHFRWNKDFFKISNTGAKIAIHGNNGMFILEAGMNIFGNYVYLDTLAIPAASEKSIVLGRLLLEKKFRWKGFNQINKILVQSVSPDDDIKLPLVAFGNTTYYENAFFKRVLKVQLGFDFFYNTLYYADSYMPATGLFYRQDIQEVGDYPFLDVFFNWKIKRTRFFLKLTNSLSGIAGYKYFTTYGYPMNERGLRFGLAWTFYN